MHNEIIDLLGRYTAYEIAEIYNLSVKQVKQIVYRGGKIKDREFQLKKSAAIREDKRRQGLTYRKPVHFGHKIAEPEINEAQIKPFDPARMLSGEYVKRINANGTPIEDDFRARLINALRRHK